MENKTTETQNPQEKHENSPPQTAGGEKPIALTTWRKIATEVDHAVHELKAIPASAGKANAMVYLLRFRGEVIDRLKEARTIEHVERRYTDLFNKYRELQSEYNRQVGQRLQ